MIGSDLGKAFRKLANDGDLKGLKRAWTPELMAAKGSPSGKTALHFASSKGHSEAVDFLISKGADLNEPDADLNTPLMLALLSGHRLTALLFLGANAKVITNNKDNLNPLQMAKNNPTLKGDAELINLIKKKIYRQAHKEHASRGEVHISDSGEITCSLEEDLIQAMAQVKLTEPRFEFPDLKKTYALLKKDIKKLSVTFDCETPVTLELLKQNCRLIRTVAENYFGSKSPLSSLDSTKRQQLQSLWHKTLDILTNILASDKVIHDAAEAATEKADLISIVYLFRTICCYDDFVDKLNQYPTPDADQLKEIKDAFQLLIDNHAFVHYYSNADALNDTYKEMKRRLMVNIHRFSNRYNSLWLGYDELQFHIDRKNKESEKLKTPYHAELIYNPNALSMNQLDDHCLDTLVSKIQNIRAGHQPRTQFIIDITGQGHALTCDISWNEKERQIQIICVEATQIMTQFLFLLALRPRLWKEGIVDNIIAIQAGLQHDRSSCYTYAYLLSRLLSKFTFAELQQLKEVPQPSFYNKGGFTNHDLIPWDPPRIPPVKWLPVTALGEKVVRMDQSFKNMRVNLLKIYPKREAHVDTLIAHWKKCYHVDPPLYQTEEEQRSCKTYVAYRRNALRLQYKQTPLEGITMEKIYGYTDSTTPAQALRRLGAGWGPKKALRFMLKEQPKVVNEIGGKEELTALDWAYRNKKTTRQAVLIEAGAKTASDIKKKKLK